MRSHHNSHTHTSRSVQVHGTEAVCVTDAVRDGTYNSNKLYRQAGMVIPPASVLDNFNNEQFGVPSRLQCYLGASTCEGRARFLPKRMPMPPPLPPMPVLPEHIETASTVASFPARTTPRPASTTQAAPTTTQGRGRRDLGRRGFSLSLEKAVSPPANTGRGRRNLLSVVADPSIQDEVVHASNFASGSNAMVILVVGVVCAVLALAGKIVHGKKQLLPK